MPIMQRPNSKAKKLHAQIILHTQEFGADSEFFDVEKFSPKKTPNLLKQKKFKDASDSGSFVGDTQGI